MKYIVRRRRQSTTAAGVVDDTLRRRHRDRLQGRRRRLQGRRARHQRRLHEGRRRRSSDERGRGRLRRRRQGARPRARRCRASGQSAQQFEGARELLNRQGLKTFAAGLAVTGSAVKLKAAAAQQGRRQRRARSPRRVAALPAGSWAALGLGDIGKSLSEALDSLKTARTPGLRHPERARSAQAAGRHRRAEGPARLDGADRACSCAAPPHRHRRRARGPEQGSGRHEGGAVEGADARGRRRAAAAGA